MKIIDCEVRQNYQLIVSSDWHIGAANCDLKGIKAMLEDAKKSKAYLTFNGDLLESIDVSDKRFSVKQAAMDMLTLQEQINFIVDLLMPYRKQILCIGMGNHEHKHINRFNPTVEICRRLDVPYGTVTYILEMKHGGKLMHRLLLTHGSGGMPKGAKDPIQRRANQGAWIKRRLEETGIPTIFSAFGHTHHLQVVPPSIDSEVHLTVKGGKLKQIRRSVTNQAADHIPPEARWFANTGSFLKLYSDGDNVSYGEIRMYSPPKLGYVKLVCKDTNVVDVQEVLV